MHEQTPPTTTGAVLGQYYKDLVGAGIAPEIADQAVLIAARGLTGDGEIAVSTPVSA